MDYGIIGNCHTCALVHKSGSIEWFCYPDFSSPSFFAKILDKNKGGFFAINAIDEATFSQSYLKNTNILETIVTTKKGSFKIIDFMPRFKKFANKRTVVKGNYLVRLVEPISGKIDLKVLFNPAPDYARQEGILSINDKHIQIKSDNSIYHLATNAKLENIAENETFTLDKPLYFVLGELDEPNLFDMKRVKELFNGTKNYWLEWVESLVLPQNNREQIIRSALVLKLLTYSKTGAIVAAPTTSIPEEIGSDRCFDYRFCWVRDSAFAIDALSKIGKLGEAKKFMDFMIDRVTTDDHLQIMYGIHGETKLVEEELNHLEGYENSKPVRIGNAAYNQDQYDIYGEMIDVMFIYYVYYEFEETMPKKNWRFLEWLVNQIRFRWDKRDSGIWEFRGSVQHFTYSKIMCWVGVDRAIKIAQKYGKNDLTNKWIALLQEIRNDVLKNGYDLDLHAFTMYYGGKELDASLLHMTYHELLEPSDPRIINTVKKIYEELRKDHLVQRYKIKDDFGKSKSAFTICSFWMIDSLIYIGEIEKANEMYNKLVTCSNHVGLFSEDIEIATGKLAGNFPQAYTHIAMINTSILLSEWSSKRKKIDWTINKKTSWF